MSNYGKSRGTDAGSQKPTLQVTYTQPGGESEVQLIHKAMLRDDFDAELTVSLTQATSNLKGGQPSDYVGNEGYTLIIPKDRERSGVYFNNSGTDGIDPIKFGTHCAMICYRYQDDPDWQGIQGTVHHQSEGYDTVSLNFTISRSDPIRPTLPTQRTGLLGRRRKTQLGMINPGPTSHPAQFGSPGGYPSSHTPASPKKQRSIFQLRRSSSSLSDASAKASDRSYRSGQSDDEIPPTSSPSTFIHPLPWRSSMASQSVPQPIAPLDKGKRSFFGFNGGLSSATDQDSSYGGTVSTGLPQHEPRESKSNRLMRRTKSLLSLSGSSAESSDRLGKDTSMPPSPIPTIDTEEYKELCNMDNVASNRYPHAGESQ